MFTKILIETQCNNIRDYRKHVVQLREPLYSYILWFIV